MLLLHLQFVHEQHLVEFAPGLLILLDSGVVLVEINGDEDGRGRDLRRAILQKSRLVHHVAQQLSRRVSDLHVEGVVSLLIDAHDALVALKEGQRAVVLQVEV